MRPWLKRRAIFIARKRIARLLRIAGESRKYNRRYTLLAKRIAMRLRIRIPKEQKRFICKNCNEVRVLGKDLKARVIDGHLYFICTVCGRRWKIS